MSTLLCCLLIGATMTVAPSIPIDHPIPTPRKLEVTAQRYWQSRGLHIPRPVQVFEVPYGMYDPGSLAFGEFNAPYVWLTDAFMFQSGEIKCMNYIHERGHNAGLTHDSTWKIMNHSSTSAVPRCERLGRGRKRKT